MRHGSTSATVPMEVRGARGQRLPPPLNAVSTLRSSGLRGVSAWDPVVNKRS